MSARTRLILAGVLAFVICVVFFFVFIRPRNAELKKVTDQVDAAEGETAALRSQLEVLEGLQKDAPQLRAELNEFRELVPKQDDFYNFMLQMIDAADAAGVALDQLDPELPASPPEAPELAEIPILIRVQGGYFGLQDFTRRVQELDRAVSINGTNLTTAEEGEGEQPGQSQGPVILQMSVRIFFELPAVQAPITVPGEVPVTTPEAGTTPAPGETPAPAAPATTPTPAG